MRAVVVVLIVIFASTLINWIRAGSSLPIVRSLPFCGGRKPGTYEVGAILMILLFLWGLARLRRGRGETVETEPPPPEEPEGPEGSDHHEGHAEPAEEEPQRDDEE